jgi:hypothetical protein
MKTLSLPQFTSAKIDTSDYQKKDILEQITKAKEISQFHPCEVKVSVSEQDGKLYFEHTHLKLKHESLDMTIRFDNHRKKYSIWCDSIRGLKNVTSYTIQDEKKKLVEPKNIGVLTTKKINDWLTYYEQLYNNLEALNESNESKEQKFLDSLKGLKVDFDKDRKGGEVIKNGIRFRFKIEPTYIRQEIEIHYECESNLNTFLKLSDNKYK